MFWPDPHLVDLKICRCSALKCRNCNSYRCILQEICFDGFQCQLGLQVLSQPYQVEDVGSWNKGGILNLEAWQELASDSSFDGTSESYNFRFILLPRQYHPKLFNIKRTSQWLDEDTGTLHISSTMSGQIVFFSMSYLHIVKFLPSDGWHSHGLAGSDG